jgi:hypothetical protein
LGFPISDLFPGFLHVKHFIENDQSGMTFLPNTWIVSKLYAKSGCNFAIERDHVFVDQLVPKLIKDHISRMKTSISSDAGDADKKKQSSGSQEAMTGKRSAPGASTTPPSKKAKTNEGRAKEGPKATKATTKPPPNLTLVKPSAKDTKRRTLQESGLPPSKSVGRIKFHDEDLDVKRVEEKKVKEGSEILAKISKYYIWGIDQIFSILVKLIDSAPPLFYY